MVTNSASLFPPPAFLIQVSWVLWNFLFSCQDRQIVLSIPASLPVNLTALTWSSRRWLLLLMPQKVVRMIPSSRVFPLFFRSPVVVESRFNCNTQVRETTDAPAPLLFFLFWAFCFIFRWKVTSRTSMHNKKGFTVNTTWYEKEREKDRCRFLLKTERLRESATFKSFLIIKTRVRGYEYKAIKNRNVMTEVHSWHVSVVWESSETEGGEGNNFLTTLDMKVCVGFEHREHSERISE